MVDFTEKVKDFMNSFVQDIEAQEATIFFYFKSRDKAYRSDNKIYLEMMTSLNHECYVINSADSMNDETIHVIADCLQGDIITAGYDVFVSTMIISEHYEYIGYSESGAIPVEKGLFYPNPQILQNIAKLKLPLIPLLSVNDDLPVDWVVKLDLSAN